MNYLLDSHNFLWWDNAPQKMSAASKAICEDVSNVLFLSYASIWEISIKESLKKITLRLPLKTIVESQQQLNKLQLLPIKTEHLYTASALPYHHKDPFDRLIVAQAQLENMTLLSADSILGLYSVRIVP